jgi:hypothetical protein
VGLVPKRSGEGSGNTASMAVVWITHRGTGEPGTPLASLSRGRPTAVTVDETVLSKGGQRIRAGIRAKIFFSLAASYSPVEKTGSGDTGRASRGPRHHGCAGEGKRG